VWRSIGEPWRWALVVAFAALSLAAVNAWWVVTYRHGYPFDIDEAGYTTIAFVDYLGLKAGGLDGWREAVLNQAPNAPLLPAVTSLVFQVKAGALEGFLVLSGFLVVLALAVYGIGRRLAGPKLGALAALVTATAPGAFLFSREFVFAMPTAAFLACAVFCLLRSDGLRARRWAIACGAALGLMLLSRTMSISFVPGVLAAGVVCLLARRQEDLANRLLNLGLLVLTGAAVAATWYARNFQSVLDYLTSYGYGSQSKLYGAGNSVLSWERLRAPFVRMTVRDLLLPLAVLLLIGLATVGVVTVRRVIGAPDRAEALRRLARSDALSVAIVLLAGYAALASSQNVGNGFTYPIAALVPALAILALRLFPRAVLPTVAVLAVVVGFNLLSNLNLWAQASRTREVPVPGFGDLAFANGVPNAVDAIREQVPGPETHFDDGDRGWLKADEAVARQVVDWAGPDGALPVTAFASRNRAINTNTVELAAMFTYHMAIPVTQLNAEPDDSIGTYAEQLSNPEFGSPSVLITTSTDAGDFEPVVTQSFAEAAARRLGFRIARTMRLPDGRALRFWRRGDESMLGG
jgi:hypothetical protein